MTKFSRVWAMPSADTFDIKPIGEFVMRYLRGVSVDPFARNKRLATFTNDLNPETSAEFHMKAESFLMLMADRGVIADVVIFDPPYSPRQISECYKSAGLAPSMTDTQNARLVRECRDQIRNICLPGSVVLSFGWNSVGMGPMFEQTEIMLVCHGGAHNDTICVAEVMVAEQPKLFEAA